MIVLLPFLETGAPKGACSVARLLTGSPVDGIRATHFAAGDAHQGVADAGFRTERRISSRPARQKSQLARILWKRFGSAANGCGGGG